MSRFVVRFARNAVFVALFVVAAVLGTLSGVMFAYAGDLPAISALDDYSPNTITRVRSVDGTVIGEFAVERRLVIGYDEIPANFRQAIIASEDAGFNSHFGVSISAIAFRASRDIFDAAKAVATGRGGRPAGASTLTQQLARNLFADTVGFRAGEIRPLRWADLERKIKEAIVAIQIEKRYTKPEILTLYANQMLFGHGTYGVEAAARLYFNKSAKDLTLEEAALLAGIVQLPARQSPYVNMDAALRRRAYVLQRMADEGYIPAEQAATAKQTPITLRGQPQQPKSSAPFFLEEVRKHLERQYGAKALYESGLSVTTTLDPVLQEAANRAVHAGLRSLDKRRGYRRAKRNLVAEGKRIEDFKDERWLRPIAVGDTVPAVVVAVKPAPTNTVRVSFGRYHADLGRDAFAAWPRRPTLDAFKPGDLVSYHLPNGFFSKTHIAIVSQRTNAEGVPLIIHNRGLGVQEEDWLFAEKITGHYRFTGQRN